jgi:hypothetical protein
VLAGLERGPVRLSKDGETDRERKERRRDPRGAGRPGDGHACEPHRAGTPARESASGRRKEPRRRDGGGEGDEARQQEEDDGRGAARCKLGRIDGSARQDGEGCGECSRGRKLEKAWSPPATWLERDRHADHESGERADREPEQDARRRQDALPKDGADRRPRDSCGDRAAHRSDDPAECRSSEADRGTLGRREQDALPAPRSVPGQPAPCGGEIASQRSGGEDGERDQQCGGLAAHEQQSPPRDGGVVVGRLELLGRERDRPGPGHRLELRARSVGARHQPVDLP